MLVFPQAGLDDTAAYQGYETRFYRDSKNNTVQIYRGPHNGRVVLLWADALDESAGFTARDASGRPARIEWDGDSATVADSASARTIGFRLRAAAPSRSAGLVSPRNDASGARLSVRAARTCDRTRRRHSA